MNALGTAPYLPIDLIDEKEPPTYGDFLKDYRNTESGTWKYFADRKMFLAGRGDLGFTEEDFGAIIGPRIDLWKSFVLFLEKPEETEEGK